MIPPAKRIPQRTRKEFGPGGSETALVGALARLFFDINESQFAGEIVAIRISVT
jgi:hypothetical protein